MLKLKKKKQKGFTLIELVAVIAIIAILAAALVPKVSGYMEESKKVAVLSQAKNVVTAYEAVSLKNSLTESTTIATLLTKSGNLLADVDVSKLDTALTVAACKNLLDTEKYTFTISDGKATTVSSITEDED